MNSRERIFGSPFIRLLCAQPLASFCVCAFYLLPKFMTKQLHASAWQIGLVSAAYGLAGALAVPLLALSIDRVSMRRLVLAGYAATAFAALGFVWVDRVGALVLVLRTLQGLAWAASFTGGLMLTIRYAPPGRLAQAIGYYGVANLGMNAIAPATAEIVADKIGWLPNFLMASLAGWLAFAIGYHLPSDRPAPAREVRMLSLLCRGSSLMMMTIAVIWGVAFGAMFIFHQPFALAMGIANVRGFFVAYTLTAVFARMGTGNVVDRIGRYRVSIASLTLYAVVVLTMQWLRPGWLEPIGAAFGLAHGFFFPAYSALVVERTPAEERGKLMTLFNAAFNAGFGIGGLLLGGIAERNGYPALFLVAGLVTAMGVGLLLIPASRGVAREAC